MFVFKTLLCTVYKPQVTAHGSHFAQPTGGLSGAQICRNLGSKHTALTGRSRGPAGGAGGTVFPRVLWTAGAAGAPPWALPTGEAPTRGASPLSGAAGPGLLPQRRRGPGPALPLTAPEPAEAGRRGRAGRMRRGGGSGRAAGVRRSWDERGSARAERGRPAASFSPAAEVRAGRGGAGTLLNVTPGAGAGGAAGEGRWLRLPAAPNPPLANAGRAAKRVGV